MKNPFTKVCKRICSLALALILPCEFITSFAAGAKEGVVKSMLSPNNAAAVVARGEDAFKKSEDAFSAKWIWTAEDDGSKNRWMAFRKKVTLEASDLGGRITAKISADTKYWLWINGGMAVYEGQLKRGPALLKKDIYPEKSTEQPDLNEMLGEVETYYDEVVLTPFLKEGENTIVALVWYFGNEGHSHVGSGKGAFLFESQMGEKLVTSDESWKVSRHKGYQPSEKIGVHSQEFHIVYDASKGYNDFYLPEYDDSAWASAAVIGSVGDKPWNDLWRRSIPEWKVWDRVTFTAEDTEHVTKINGGYRVSFPTNIHFSAYIKVKAPAGKTIKITSPNSGDYSVTYTTMGGSDGSAVVQEYESPTWMNWWFTDYSIPAGVEVIELGYRRSGYNAEQTGYFNCNDEFFNRLWTKARDTAYVNIRDTFMDCPDAERCAWFGDMVNEAQIAYYTLDDSVFDSIRKDIAVRINWQNADGVIPTTVPSTFRYNEYAELTGQSLAGVMSWFQYYLYSGDRVALEHAYPALLKYMDMFDLDIVSYTVPYKRGKGTNTMHLNWVDWGNNIDKDLCLNIWSYIGVKTVIAFANELSDTETAARYEAIREVMADKFGRTFWNGKEYRSATYNGPADDRGQALAVYAGLVSPDKYPIIRDILLNNRFASPYMVKYSVEALYIMGYPEAGEQRMADSYAQDVALSDPTFSENWNGGGTKNHGWSGGGLISLSGYEAGVRPTKRGYEEFLVKPQLGGRITDITAGIPCVKGGLIKVDISKKSDLFSLSVNVPSGTTAIIAVPRLSCDTAVKCGETLVWNNGTVPFDVAGLKYDHDDYSHIYFRAASGDWAFKAVSAIKSGEKTFRLKIESAEGGRIFVDGNPVELPYDGGYTSGAELSVKAVADNGFCFESFDGSIGARTEEIHFSIESDKKICPRFVKIPSFDGYDLTLTSNKTSRLTVNGKETSFPYINCIENGASVTVKALDNENYVFSKWHDADGNTFSTEAEITLAMSEAKKLSAWYVDSNGENLALGKRATASSSVENFMFGIEKATDGIYTEELKNEGWTSTETEKVQWITVDLENPVSVSVVKLFPRNDGGESAYGIPEDMQILVSEDGSKWEEVYSVTGQKAPLVESIKYSFSPKTARYVKVNGTKLRGNPKDSCRPRFQISEIEIFAGASDTEPQIVEQPKDIFAAADTALSVSVSATGKMPIYYQWQVSTDGGKNYDNIKNADGRSYEVSIYDGINGNLYRCVVKNPLGSVISEAAKAEVVSKNYALGARVTSSTAYAGDTALRLRYVSDGITDTQEGENEGWSSKDNKGGSEWVMFEFDEITAVNRLVMYPRIVGADAGYGVPEDYKISVSTDRLKWTEVYSAVATERPTSGCIVADFKPAKAKFVKLEGTKLRKSPFNRNRKRMQLTEVEIYWKGLAPILKGDVDENGNVNVSDALMALRMNTGMVNPTAKQLRSADMDGDGEISVADALAILRCAIGMTTPELA